MAAALDSPWEEWTVFLHPAQRELVEGTWDGPARVAGTAGTGKTVVALHRAAYLAKTNPSARVLVTTFNGMLAQMLREKLRRLLVGQAEVLERIEVSVIDRVGYRLYDSRFGPVHVVSDNYVRFLLREAAAHGSGPLC